MSRWSLGIPPLGGIASYAEAGRPGLSVDRNVELLKRYAFVERRLMEIALAHLCGVPEWEVKCGLALHCWLDAEHATAFRQRVAELREPPLHLDAVPDERLAAALDEALRARDTVELLAGLYRVLRPALVEAYRRHMAQTNPLADHPTSRQLGAIVAEEQELIAWGQSALAALAAEPAAAERAAAWAAHVAAYLRAAGGVWGEAVPADADLPPPRAASPFAMELLPRRDGRFKVIFAAARSTDDAYADETRTPHERTIALMYKRLREMDVPEMMAPLIARTPGKPWEYYREMTRQLWDETRHAMMGEVAFESLGVDWTATPASIFFSYMLNRADPIEAHTRLDGIEQRLMSRTGKRREWEVAAASGLPVATTFQDYDWADEVLHARIGRRWLVPQLGGQQAAAQFVERTNQRLLARNAGDPNLAEPEPVWWTSFYESNWPTGRTPAGSRRRARSRRAAARSTDHLGSSG